jgi:ubiquinone biosynthesis monooxygenase Coq7
MHTPQWERPVLPKGYCLPGEEVRHRAVLRPLLRVNHAGEYGAKRIYEGQYAVLARDPKAAGLLQHMLQQELTHLHYFDRVMAQEGVRPTALLPLWHGVGYLLGVGSALLGYRAAMACTEAVETVIDGHYAAQLAQLQEAGVGATAYEAPALPSVQSAVAQFRAEEQAHRDCAIAEGALQAPGYRVLHRVIAWGCRLAIACSKRI